MPDRLERASGAPFPHGSRTHIFVSDSEEPTNVDWPMTVYIMPDGEVHSRREPDRHSSSTVLKHQAFLVLRIHPGTETTPPKVEVVKDRTGNFPIQIVKIMEGH